MASSTTHTYSCKVCCYRLACVCVWDSSDGRVMVVRDIKAGGHGETPALLSEDLQRTQPIHIVSSSTHTCKARYLRPWQASKAIEVVRTCVMLCVCVLLLLCVSGKPPMTLTCTCDELTSAKAVCVRVCGIISYVCICVCL